MAVSRQLPTQLNPIQVSLLRLFNRPISEGETERLQTLLVEHFSAMLEEEVNRVVKKRATLKKISTKCLMVTNIISLPQFKVILNI